MSKGELLSSILPKEKVKSIHTKIASAKEDWKKFISTVHQKETALEVWDQLQKKSISWNNFWLFLLNILMLNSASSLNDGSYLFSRPLLSRPFIKFLKPFCCRHILKSQPFIVFYRLVTKACIIFQKNWKAI